MTDAALSRLLSRMTYKADWNKRTLKAAGEFYPSSQICFDCRYVYEALELKDRKWTCPECGIPHDRNKNAARNLWKLALLVDRRDVTLPNGKALTYGRKAVGGTGPDEGRTWPNARNHGGQLGLTGS